jgi:hypothetical protein
MALTRRDLENRAQPSKMTIGTPCRVAGKSVIPASLDRFAQAAELGSQPQWDAVVATNSPRLGTAMIFLGGTRQASGIVPAMQPCTTLNGPVAWPPRSAPWRSLEGRRSIALRPGRPGTSTTQEETHDFESSAPVPGNRASCCASFPPPSSEAAHGRADRNHTVNTKMLSALFCVPTSGTYPLASYIIMMGYNSLNGAADACGR